VGLSVGDLRAAEDFYLRAFDFEAEVRFGLAGGTIDGVMLRHPDGHRLELFEHRSSVPGIHGVTPIEALATRGYGHFALGVPDLDPVFERARVEGAEVLVPPGPSPEPGVRFAFLADPEGNLIELVERRS
jgi:glyoxylase I family protein